jgi:hypothetical protein
MKIKTGAAAALAAAALVLGGCGSPNNAGSPPGKASAGPSSTPNPSGEPTVRPTSVTPKSAGPTSAISSPPAGRTSPTGPAKNTPGASPNADGQEIDPQSDENAQPTKKGEQTAVLNRVPGKKSETCVVVGARRDVRSGDFLAGAFDTARSQYGHTQPGTSKRSVRLYFVPLHAKKMPELKLTFTHAGSGEIVVVRQKQIADAEQWKFYDTRTVLKHPGRWRVQAAAGPDRGCFSFVLPKY